MNNDEILFEATSRNAETFEGYTLRLYNSGLYQKITYSKSCLLENSEQKIETIGENPEAIRKVKEVLRHNRALGLEAYINDYDEIRINNPYASSELCYAKFEKCSFIGMNLFTVFPEDELEKLNEKLTKEEKSAYRKVRTISRLKSEMVILLRQIFEIEGE